MELTPTTAKWGATTGYTHSEASVHSSVNKGNNLPCPWGVRTAKLCTTAMAHLSLNPNRSCEAMCTVTTGIVNRERAEVQAS